MTQKNEPLITALYERLSRDDDQQGDSNSIVNQKSYLTSYAADHGFTHCRHYTDDGFSGGNFERPGWKQLIADIDAGLVGVVIAKDLSRVGRDYIQTGFYTEVYFRRKGVRFIAIGNGVDTVNPISSEFAPLHERAERDVPAGTVEEDAHILPAAGQQRKADQYAVRVRLPERPGGQEPLAGG